jgi:DNA-binding HxlR family transcriptional regulator
MPLENNFDIGQDASGMDALELPSANDFVILRAMGDDDDAQDISFQGIKRKLGLHQETLSRALHRLQRDGYIERLEKAYRISQKGMSTISQVRPRIRTVEENDPYSVTLLQAILPRDFNVNSRFDTESELRGNVVGN